MLGELAALGAAVSWAVAPILYRKALFKTKPVSANIVRCVSNAAVLLVVLLVTGNGAVLASLPLEAIAMVVASGLIGLGLGDTLYMVGLKSVGVSRAVPLASTYPLFSLLWAILLLGEPVALPAVVGAVVILLGIWLLSHEKENGGKGLQRGVLVRGVAASLVTAVVWSISITLIDAALKIPSSSGLDVNFAILTLRLAPLSVVLLAFAPVLDKKRGFLKMKRRTAVELCVGGLVANGVGWLLMNVSLLNILESQAIPISSTSPLFSAVAGFALFHEKMTVNNLLGAVLVVVGIFMIFVV
ncbi:MAG: DMT family transporter [Candidatus Bathyarchaeota archaeon]|nr:DMT family transporter [Candidatus Bathyarchaeota archaeon]